MKRFLSTNSKAIHGLKRAMGFRIFSRRRQRGAAMMEFIIAIPALLALGLGGMQTALVYNSKNIVKYAAFEAARAGSVGHAQTSSIREEFGIRIAPLFGGDGSGESAASAIARGILEASDPRYTDIEILNPTRQAFEDFGFENDDGVIEIPNIHIKHRARTIGASSGVNIQDANILKVRITYAYELKVPMINRLVTSVLMRTDPANFRYYALNRIPVTTTATIHMQSAAYEDENNVDLDEEGEEGSIPEEEEDEEGQGGGDDSEPFDPECDPETGEGCDDDSDLGGGMCAFNSGGDTVGIDDGSQSATNNPLSMPSIQTGNPINVVTGNKTLIETDISLNQGGLGLRFNRFYNSFGVKNKHVIGRGWRHSYQISAKIQDNDSVSIIQPDGRRLIFEKTSESDTYIGRVIADGTVTISDSDVGRIIWKRNDSYKLQFNSSGFLNLITSPTGGTLSLSYFGEGKIRKVRDDLSRSLVFEYYPNGRLKKVFDPDGNSVTYAYDEIGNLFRVTNRDGNDLIYHYENDSFPHHITGITNEDGVRFANYAYDSLGRGILSEHADGVGRVALEYLQDRTITVDGNGSESTYFIENRNGIALVTEVRGPGCDACSQGDLRYYYDDKFQLEKVVFSDGRILDQVFDEQGRLEKRTVSDARTGKVYEKVEYEYLASKRLPSKIIEPSVFSSGDHVRTIDYNELMQPTKITESGWQPLEGGDYSQIERTTRLVYQDYRLSEIDGPREDVADITRFEYDAIGNIISITGPEGNRQEVLLYDSFGRPLEISNDGAVTRLSYDFNGNIKSIESHGQKTELNYSASGRVTQVIKADGKTTNFEYDDAGRHIGTIDSEGNKSSWKLDANGYTTSEQLSSIDSKSLKSIAYVYDAMGRIKQLTEHGKKTDAVYDDLNRVISVVNKSGAKVKVSYNPIGQVVALSKPGNMVTKYHYNQKSLLDEIEDSKGNVTRYKRDDFGRLVILESPDAGLKIYSYDQSNNVITYKNGDGEEASYRYDAANRLLNVENKDGVFNLSYTRAGRISEIDGPSEITKYGYDEHGFLKSHMRVIDGFEFETAYEYSDIGQLLRKKLPNGEALLYHYHRDGPKVGMLQSIIKEGFWGDKTIVRGLNSETDNRRQKSFKFGNGISNVLSFDNHGDLTRIENGDALDLDYTYDRHGNISSLDWKTHVDEHKDTFEYDGRGFLSKSETRSGEHVYEYDDFGNRTLSYHNDDSQVALYAQGSNRQIGKAKELIGDLIEYNNSGSPLEIGKRRYVYNQAQRPIKLYEDETLIVEYFYNSWGERNKKTVYQDGQSASTYYLYDGRKLFAEANDNGEITKQYIYHLGKPISILTGGNTYAVHTDHLGTARSITDSDQNTVWAANYDPYGKAYIAGDPDKDGEEFKFNIRFSGQYEDAESGTYYNYFRDYDPESGRYLTPDPMGLKGGPNAYLYAGANPINYVDPLGLHHGDPHEVPIDLTQPSVIPGVSTPIPPGNDPWQLIEGYEIGVYVYDGIYCSGEPRTDEGRNAFQDGVDTFTNNPGRNIITLHNDGLSRIIEETRLYPNIEQARSESDDYYELTGHPGFIPYDVRTDGSGCDLLYWVNCEDVDREDNFGQLMSHEVFHAFAEGVEAIDLSYSFATTEDVSFENRANRTGAILVINEHATEAEIRSEVRSLLGGFAGEVEINRVIDQIRMQVDLEGDNQQPALVNLQPLYDRVLARFNNTIFEDPDVIRTFDDFVQARSAYILAGSPIPNYDNEITTLHPTERRMNATRRLFEEAQKRVHMDLVVRGYYPRHEYDQEADARRYEALTLAIEVATLFTPVEWVSIIRRGYSIASGYVAAVGLPTARIMARNAISRVPALARLGSGSAAARRSLEETYARFLLRSANRQADNLAQSFRNLLGGRSNIADNLSFELQQRIQSMGLSVDALRQLDSLAAEGTILARIGARPEILNGWRRITDDFLDWQRTSGSNNFQEYWNSALSRGNSLDEMRDFAALREWRHVDNPSWSLYPPNRGFAGAPVRATLSPDGGMVLSRYSENIPTNDTGGFFAPDGTPLPNRALPGNTADIATEYHYRILREFEVDSGTASRWFDAPGGGMQYDVRTINPATGEAYTTQGLIRDGFILPIDAAMAGLLRSHPGLASLSDPMLTGLLNQGATFSTSAGRTIVRHNGSDLFQITESGAIVPARYDFNISGSSVPVGDVSGGYQLVNNGGELYLRRAPDTSLYSPSELAELNAHPSAHVLERHGHDVTDDALIKRANSGIAPDGSTTFNGNPPPHSSRFADRDKLIEALENTRPGTQAFDNGIQQGNRRIVTYTSPNGDFGVGVPRGTNAFEGTSHVRAVYQDMGGGNYQLVTMFPDFPI